MRLRALLTFFLGVVIAGSAVIYTRVVMKNPTAVQAVQDVVVADVDIEFGDVIRADMLSIRSWPSNALPSGVFASSEEILGDDDTSPRRAKRAIAAGDLVLNDRISDFGEQVTITQRIDIGMRAVAIRVNDVTGVAGFVAPSDRVDVTLTRTADQTLSTSTILQNVQVLGIDQASDGASSSKPSVVKTVTVQVKPRDAQKLALAQQAGTLSLSLRHVDAGDQPPLDTISVRDLTGRSRPTPLIQRPKLPSIVVNRGGERITVEVPSG